MRPSDAPVAGQQEGRARGERGLRRKLASCSNSDREAAAGKFSTGGPGLGKHVTAAFLRAVLAGEVGVGRRTADFVGGGDEPVIERGAPGGARQVEARGADDADTLPGDGLS